MQYTLDIVLPFSKKKVTLTQPTWGFNAELRRANKIGKMDQAEITQMLMAKIATVDGEPVSDMYEFEKWPEKDYIYMVDQYNQWDEDTAGPAKNELPTSK